MAKGGGLLSHLTQEVQTRCTCWALFTNFRRSSVSGISQANPARVTTSQAHTLSTGDVVTLQEVAGMTQINDAASAWVSSAITVVDDNNFDMDSIDSTAYGAYTSDGLVREVLGFTDHIADITVDGILFRAESAFTPDAVNTFDGGSVDTAEVGGMLDNTIMVTAPSIVEPDIIAGKFDLAEVRMFQVDYTNPGGGKLWLKRGWLGQFESKQDVYKAELRGLTNILTQQLLELYSAGCRYDFGSTRCGIDLGSYTTSGSVGSVVSQREFSGASGEQYRYGLLTFTSGLNAGLSSEVQDAGGNILLFDSMPFTIQGGDGFSLTQGCDKQLATCRDRYSNVVNHGGYHYLPGQDTIQRVVNAKKPVILSIG